MPGGSHSADVLAARVDPTLALACGAALLAGFIDAIAGGGGLIQLPALLVLYPNVPPTLLFGTNKLASLAGTSTALARYAREVPIPWRTVAPAAAAAFVASFLGARAASSLPVAWMRPVVLVLLLGVLAVTLRGVRPTPHADTAPVTRAWAGPLLGVGLGFYDGFFGPGTGSFLLFALVTWMHLDFLTASASAKLVNVGTNVAALIAFAAAGQVRWEIALPMAVCNVAGAQLGAHLALRGGPSLVRRVFIVVVSALLARLAWTWFGPT